MDTNITDHRPPGADPRRAQPAIDALAGEAPISRQIWAAKYQLKAADGTPIDHSIEDTWRRVARALAAAEAEPDDWEPVFYETLADFKFLPAGRIMSGAGSDRRVTLFNCFVMGDIADDLGSIFDNLREAALTMQQGGGIGYDFSSLRPKGAPVRGVGADASGPLSFMDVWDAMCRTIMSAGARRGAMMATLRCDHPDIEAFIAAKREPGRLRNFNLSVLVTDDFMACVKDDFDWNLTFGGEVFRTVRARALWDNITRATYDYAEPGVLFIDRINDRNNLSYCETIRSTNPCAEQPLPPYGACLLGSINLARLVRHPFTTDAEIVDQDVGDLVLTAVRMMDNTIDVSGFPLEAQREEAFAKRRIGLGITGLADALMMCGLRYGSVEAAETASRWAKLINREAYFASTALAEEKGSFPLFDRERFLAGQTVSGLDENVQATIRTYGIRNALLTSIAPTGTISLVAGNVSGGIEPVFAHSFTRRVREPDGSTREEEVTDYAVNLYRSMFGADVRLPDHFVTAQDLTPAEHIRMQAAVQRHVDSAISKTVNVPEDIGFEAFQEVYLDAYRSGCKGCTTYRPNAITGSVLTVAPTVAPTAAPAAGSTAASTLSGNGAAPDVSHPDDETAASHQKAHPPAGQIATALLSRGEALSGVTYKLHWPESAHAFYVTINDIEQDGLRRPMELFVNSKNLESYAWVVALTRMISAVWRRGGPVAFVASELQEVFDPRGGHWQAGRYVPSLVAAIGDVIERHMKETGFLAQPDRAENAVSAGGLGMDRANGAQSVRTDLSLRATSPAAASQPEPAGRAYAPVCPQCSQPGLVSEAGCRSCLHCGWSKCS